MEMSEIYNGSQWAHDIFLVNKAGATEYITGCSPPCIWQLFCEFIYPPRLSQNVPKSTKESKLHSTIFFTCKTWYQSHKTYSSHRVALQLKNSDVMDPSLQNEKGKLR